MTRRGAGSGVPSAIPSVVSPMLPSQGDLPERGRADWAVEFAWAGFRCVAYAEPDRVRLLSSTARNVTNSFPELAVLRERAPGAGMVLDGVVVALDDAGRPSRLPLMRRTATIAPSEGLLDRVPIGFVVTDLLWLDGRSLLRSPYHQRRALLEELEIGGPPVLVPPSHPADEAEFVMEAAERYGLDGLHLKRVDASYKSGRRTKDWLRVPLRRSRPVVVGGWLPADGRGRIAALLLGIPESPGGPLRYVGRVGVGSTQARREIAGLIRTMNARTSSFAAEGPGAVPGPVAAGARWLRPELVGRAEYQGWTRGAHLRLPVWGGLVEPDEIEPDEWDGTPWHQEQAPAAEEREVFGPGLDPPPAPPAAPTGPTAPTAPTPPPAPFAASSLNRSLEQHFVYNTFNTIASIMRTDAGKARELLLGFADLSRTADRVGSPAIPLSEELAAVRAYLDIEKARFGRRLDPVVEVAAEVAEVEVAPLQILAVVRETVQRSIEQRPDGGRLVVTVVPAGGGAVVEVVDEGHTSTRVVLPAPSATTV
ncbi:histidine kinase [Pseudonocardia oroxyli]|nr:histidine kinase [Pseudonocardia oroxyli]